MPTRDGLAAGNKYLDAGTLYAAKFNADGTGTWLKLDLSNAAVAGNAGYAFADLADVSSTHGSPPMPPARPRWTGPSGPRSIRPTARSTSR